MSHYAFDLDFQRHLLAAFLGDEKFLKGNVEVLSPEYFGDEILQGMAETTLAFFKAHQGPPDKSAILEEIKANIAPGRRLTEYEEEIERVYEKIGVNEKYYQERAVDFARLNLIRGALLDSSTHLDLGDTEKVMDLIAKAAKTGRNLDGSNLYNFFDNLKERTRNYFKGNEREGTVPTGFGPLDERIGGGLAPGETGVIIAPAKHGKTTAMVSFAANDLLLGKRVLYVTLELSSGAISSKFDSNIFGESIEAIKKKPRDFWLKMEEIRKKIRGGLNIVQYPTKSLTMDQLGSLIEKLSPEVVFIDYANLMKTREREAKRSEVTEIHENLRGLAGTCKIPIWTAHQANRPALFAKVVDMEHIAEDITVAAIADVLISVNQSDPEKRQGLLRLYIMGNRLGASGDEILCNVSWPSSRITLSFGDMDKDLGGNDDPKTD